MGFPEVDVGCCLSALGSRLASARAASSPPECSGCLDTLPLCLLLLLCSGGNLAALQALHSKLTCSGRMQQESAVHTVLGNAECSYLLRAGGKPPRHWGAVSLPTCCSFYVLASTGTLAVNNR